MEKFRAFLEVLKKYHFWVLCGLIVLLAFGSWFMATSAEESAFTQRKGQIEGKFTMVKAISNNLEHPSAEYIKRVREIESGPLANQVKKASSRLYDEQHAANPLPKVFPRESDQRGFEAAFERIWGPMEDIEKLPPGQLDETYRSRYRDHIEEHFPQLFELIERRTVVGEEGENAPAAHGRGGREMGILGGGDAAKAKQTVGIVDWDDAEKKMKIFSERFAGATPTTLDIMMAQEELWVYETLLKVIRNTNDVGADPKHDPKNYRKPANHKVARIKQILAMDIGRDAVQSWTNCERALFDAAAEGGHGAAGNRGGPAPTAMTRQPMASRGSGMGQSSGASPLAGRYVDDKGKPLADPTQQPFGEFRMMPINLKVVIEQKEIPRLLAECANSAMRIDVRGVRILVEAPPAENLAAGAAATESAAPAGSLRPAERGGMHFGGMTRGSDDSGGKGGEFVYSEESADPVYQPVPVEVQGVIYIYNPPRIENSGEAAGDSGGQAVAAQPGGAGVANPIAAPRPAAPAGAAVPGAMAPGTGPRPVAAPAPHAPVGGTIPKPHSAPATGGRP